MTFPRRTFLRLAAGAAALPAMPHPTRAQAFPSRPITIIVPYLAGGPADGLARPLAGRMSQALGQQVVIENVPGQSGVPGVERAVKAAPDGYTLSYGHNGSHVVNGAVYSLSYDLRSDLEPIALLPSNPLMISARKDFPAANLKELIAWLKANPEKARTGNVGPASGTNVNAIYFQNATGTRLAFVTEKSVQTAIKALAAGELDLLFDQASNSLPALRAGSIKAYAVTSKARTVSAPDVPTTDEGGLAGFYSANWYGLWAPRGTPKDAIVRINRAVGEALADKAVADKLSAQGIDMPPADQRTPEALGAFHKSEIEKWWPILKAAGIKG
ncbi:MAG: tripartite tricarboxylate transporter substrate binding protein BugD [Xanthobacteraceae bacterium]|nr:tripartite tricarboxylate transporter substrate binding protein BugD [Xanthobacteraceae bacterium]